jgi:hypothetical protein
MTPSLVCASCGRGEHVSRITAQEQPLCARCAQLFRLRPVDLRVYRQCRPAGPVPCFTRVQEPAEVVPFPARHQRQAVSTEQAERDRHETPGAAPPALAVSLPGAGQEDQRGFAS